MLNRWIKFAPLAVCGALLIGCGDGAGVGTDEPGTVVVPDPGATDPMMGDPTLDATDPMADPDAGLGGTTDLDPGAGGLD